MLRGIIVFAITYLLVATRSLKFVRVDKPAGALTGAVLAVALGAITPDQAVQAIDHTTIIVLFAVMGMGAFLSLDGFFERTGRLVAARARTSRRLVIFTVWGAGLLSAVVTNDAVCVLVTPLVVEWIERYDVPRLPILLALATGANTGSVMTIVGNPQNMLCGSLGHLSFGLFTLHMLPVAIVALFINQLVLVVVFRKELKHELPRASSAGELEPLFTRRSAITVAVILGTVIVYTLGAPLSFTALGGFVILLIAHRMEPNQVWQRVDWSVLLFFGSLFVAVDALARSGAAEWVFARFPLVASQNEHAGFGSWLRAAVVFLIGSNVVTNVPFILIVRPEMDRLPDRVLGWELLAMASTFAGNLTLLGSVANVIVAEKADRVGGLRFGEYLKVGLLVGLLTTIAGAIILVALH